MATTTQEVTKKDTKNVLGLFKASRNINGLIGELTQKGITQDDLSVIMSEGTRNNHFNQEISPEVITELKNKAPEGFTTGALVGGAIGAIVGGLTLTGSLIIPGSQVLLLGPALGAISGGGGWCSNRPINWCFGRHGYP